MQDQMASSSGVRIWLLASYSGRFGVPRRLLKADRIAKTIHLIPSGCELSGNFDESGQIVSLKQDSHQRRFPNLLGTNLVMNAQMQYASLGSPDGHYVNAHLSDGANAMFIITQGKVYFGGEDHFWRQQECNQALVDLQMGVKPQNTLCEGISVNSCESLVQPYGKFTIILSNQTKKLHLVQTCHLLKDWRTLQSRKLNETAAKKQTEELLGQYTREIKLGEYQVDTFCVATEAKSLFFVDHQQKLCKVTEIRGKAPGVEYMNLEALQTKRVTTLIYGVYIVDPDSPEPRVLWVGRKADNMRSTFLAVTNSRLQPGTPLKLREVAKEIVTKVLFFQLARRVTLALLLIHETCYFQAILVSNLHLSFIGTLNVATDMLFYPGWKSITNLTIISAKNLDLSDQEQRQQNTRLENRFLTPVSRCERLRLYPLSVPKSRPLVKIALKLDHKLSYTGNGTLALGLPNGFIRPLKLGDDFGWELEEVVELRLD